MLSFATVVIRHYARAAEENPMIHVEIFLKHPLAHRFCEKVTNLYVTDELRMLVERDALLDGMREEEQQEAAEQDADQEQPDDIGISVNARRTAAIEAMQAPAPMSDDEGEVEFGVDNVDIVGAKERIEENAKKIKVSNKTLTEEEKLQQEERRKKMAELAQKRKEQADAEKAKEGGESGEKEGSEEGSAEENPESPPKRKLEEGEEEAAKGENAEHKAPEEDAPKTKRIKRAAIQDDSDSEDEDVFGASEPTAAAATKKPTSSAANFFDDDSDE